MSPFNEGPPPADDFGAPGSRWDQVGIPYQSPGSYVEYSESAGLISVPPEPEAPVVLRVTSTTTTSSLYPAKVQAWDDSATPPRLSDDVDAWCQGPSGEALTATRYDGVFLGYHSDGLPVYGVAGNVTAAGGSLTVAGVNAGTGDSTSTTAGVTTEEYDLASGFTIVSTGLNTVKVVAQAATPSHWGVVTNADQKWGGQKRLVPPSGVGSDGTYGLWIQNHATLASATSVLFADPSPGVGVVNLDVTDQTGAAGSSVARTYMAAGDTATGVARPTLFFSDAQPSGAVSAVFGVGGGDGTRDGLYCVQDKSGTLWLGVSETTPAGKSPIFVGGICVGHTP